VDAGTYNALKQKKRQARRVAWKLKCLHNQAGMGGVGEMAAGARTFRGVSITKSQAGVNYDVNAHFTTLHYFLAPIARHGGRSHEIPPPESVLVASAGAPAQPRHIALQARNDSNHMAQGEGGPGVGGEASHAGKEEHGGDTAESNPDLLRTMHLHPGAECTLTMVRNRMIWCPSCLDP
jgi:hypothetical protein